MYQRLLPRTLSTVVAVCGALHSSTRLFSHDNDSSNSSNEEKQNKEERSSSGTGQKEPLLSPWDPSRHDAAHASRTRQSQEAAAARLTGLFHDDAMRLSLRSGRADASGPPAAGGGGKRIVFDEDSVEAEENRSLEDRFGVAVDEDKPLDGRAGGLVPQQQQQQQQLARQTASTRLEALEQELLDDNFIFFPPAVIASDSSSAAVSSSSTFTSSSENQEEQQKRQRAAKERYVPGQQIIPPGFTRYRVDVQYQGGDFDGWYKSTSRAWEVVERGEDGKIRRRRPATASEAAGGNNNDSIGDGFHDGSGVGAEGMQARHHARTILEDALAVALDVPSVSVIAAAIPETGVSVRRLTCHVDLPSELEMQPRTILQRATLWLQAHHQPLALLSCHPCKNQDFHARHSGVRRVYCYRILNRVAPPLFDAGLQWHVDRHLDVARMQRFAAAMEGTKDYGYFADPKMANALRRAAASQGGDGRLSTASAFSAEHEALTVSGRAPWEKTPAPKADFEKGLSQLDRAAALPTFNQYGQTVLSYDAKPREFLRARTNLPTVRTVNRIDVVRQEDEVLIWFVGQSFLRHQIRNMVSVLKASGHGLWDEHELQHAFNAGFEVSRKKFRRERLPPAPAYGLTLWEVEYPRQHRDDHVSYVDSGPFEEVDISAIN